jgi:death on curing protein
MEMSEIRYLSMADVLALHQAIMEKFGFASAPLRDEGMLESAIMGPRMAAYYSEADIIRQAALLAVGISQAQAFLDGNKRTALAASDVFLRLNGLAFVGDPIELAMELEAIAARTGNLENATDGFEEWLREQIRPTEEC